MRKYKYVLTIMNKKDHIRIGDNINAYLGE
jgi:hypothetical protein